MIGTLAGCVPAAQPRDLPVASLGVNVYTALLEPFRETLSARGIEAGEGRAYRYEGEDEAAFAQAVSRFYKENPGFCPLEEAFSAAPNGTLFLTLAGKGTGTEVRGLVYDQAKRPSLTYAVFSGKAREALKVTACYNADRR